uniref:DLEC1 cilia and flagella associated protein n=1 Tax=Oryzias latipes TaxID=8090 RepID=H2M1B4_ORYLA
MSCKYSLRFIPDSLEDYKDFLVVETQAEQVLLVPIEAQRPPPILTPKVLDCGYCLVGGLKYVEFLCQNVGQSSGTFCIIPKSQWPFSNLRSLSRTYFSEQPPFAVGPSLFQLEPGDTTVIEVVFSPTTAQKSRQTYTFVCDNCQVKDFSIEEGQLVALQLVSEEKETPEAGEIHDVTAEHYVRFDVCNPHSVQHKRLVIRNNHLDLPFQWQIRQPNLYPLPPGEVPEPSQIHFHPATDDAFRISPVAGLLPPYQDQEFLLTFCPKELKDYHSVCRLVLRDAPDPVETVIAMEIEVKGSTEPFQILLEPYAIIIPGEIFVCTTTHRQFKMWNHSKTFILFQWEKLKSSYHTMVVEPPTGRIENECFDFDLILSGRKPEKLKTNLICNIEHHLQPITLPIEVSFKGPMVTLSVPSVDFGLVRLGEQTHRSLELTNTTQLEAFWTLMISVKPCSGMLPPLGSCSVEVIFTPQFCQQFKAELELEVENGRGHVWIQADVQSPQVCLLNCKLAFTEIYLGVPKSASVTLFNQTALPAKFSWLELTEVAALCEVEGMNLPLILGIAASKPKKLSVSYSLPSDFPLNGRCTSPVELDFGDDVILKNPVTRQLLITNQTAIAAPFAIEVEYFFVSQLLADGRGAAFRVVPDSGLLGPFETQTVAVTAVTDMWGEYSDNLICKVGDLEAVIIPLRMAVRGCPLYFQMTGPRTDNQFQGPIIFGTCIPGGDTVSHPLRINNPSTFDIRMDWETYNIEKDDSKLLDVVLAFGEPFPPKDADGSEEDQGDAEGEEGCALTSHAKKKLVSVHIRPHVGKLSDYPFCINPQQIVIPAKSGATIHVSFTPLTPSECVSESRCSGLALGFMSLDFEMAACVPGKVRRAQGLELQPVRVDLQAAVKPALLVQMEEVGEALEFKASAGDLLKEFDVSQTFQLRNTSEVALHFRMETQPPFSVLKAKQKQIVPLCAHLLLSTLSLSTDRLSFGVCYVGQTKSREITLSCRGSHTYWKSTSRESHVFKVTPNFGLLRPKEPHGTCSVKQHLQISFTP